MATTTKPANMREQMPDTAEWVQQQRRELGEAHVNECIRRGVLQGLPGYFYAMERGHVLGTPFSSVTTPDAAYWQNYAIVSGCPFAGFIRRAPIRPNEGKSTNAN